MTPTPANINKGLWLGLLGIVIFAVTLPMTRLAVGTPDAPQMSGVFIALGRAVVAAALSAVFLLASQTVCMLALRAPSTSSTWSSPMCRTFLGQVSS